MFGRTAVFGMWGSYVKPAQGYITQLQARGNKAREIVHHLDATGHAVPSRRNLLDLQQQLDENTKTAASSTESVASMENKWTNETTETVGVTAETYAKWFCEHYNLSRDEYEAHGCPNTGPSNKSLHKNCDAENTLLEEKKHCAPELVMKEIINKKVHQRFWADTLKGDGEPEEVVLREQGASQEPIDAPRLE